MSLMWFWTCSPSSFVLEWHVNIPMRKSRVRGTLFWWQEKTTGVFCLAGIEELHFSPLQHLQLLGWLCDLQRHHAQCWWDTEQVCTSSPVTAQLITQLPLHLSFCFLLACDYCPALIGTSSVTKTRLFSFGLLITFMVFWILKFLRYSWKSCIPWASKTWLCSPSFVTWVLPLKGSQLNEEEAIVCFCYKGLLS